MQRFLIAVKPLLPNFSKSRRPCYYRIVNAIQILLSRGGDQIVSKKCLVEFPCGFVFQAKGLQGSKYNQHLNEVYLGPLVLIMRSRMCSF
jgi:hypothetical protein